ncbi:uncharacterized protein LOC123520587 isoform X2 [Portunus trituberculatus]|uniref:uncharacterized protein LOC123520587 isoform X2 n=1 Tax=Portunus trituberculatus TaxID=210409 RepID=UPI001E1D0E8A|nr:uncharacterized protein LOC123520587 isoform X2 [Portunus trituberculatus]
MTVVPSAGVEMDIGRLLGDMKWRKEDKLMPGVKFGIKYKSATRHRNEVHGRQPLADINTNQISRATGGGDNVTGQEQNEEGEQQETRRRKKRQRLEIPGLLHPDDLTPSRQRTNSYVGNTATKRRGKQQDKQQHTGEAGEPTQHYLVSLVRNCHRQLYGDPNKCSGQMQGEGDSTSQLPPSASSSRQLVIPSYSMDNYSLVQDATLYGPTVEENAPSIAPEKSMWQGMEWNGNGGRSDVIGQQGMWRRAAPVEGSIKLLNGVSDCEAKVNSSGSHGDRVAGERVWQWLTQDGDGARDKTCKLESRPVAENSNGFGLWRGWESPGNHDLPHQNPHSYHQATAAHHHMKTSSQHRYHQLFLRMQE